MITFINEYLWTLISLTSFALAGGFAIVPFRNTLKYGIFAAPLAGLLMITLGTSTLYNLLNLSLVTSALVSASFCLSLTIFSCFCSPSTFTRPKLPLVIFTGLTIAFITYLTNYTTLSLGHPGFLYMDGTDHLGYAHLADWLNNHLVSERPTPRPDLPYQYLPHFLFNVDPRFGSFFLLGLISDFRHLSGMFSYDFSCGLILSAAFLAISAVFSRSSFTFILLLLGLVTTHWFDYSRSGYFAKLLSFPSSLFIMGLFLNAERPFTLPAITILAILTCSATIMHSFLSTTLTFLVIGGTFILASTIRLRRTTLKNSYLLIRDNCLVLTLLIGIAIATTGTLARPTLITAFPMHSEFTWSWLLPRTFDLEYMDTAISTFSAAQLFMVTALFSFIYLLLLIFGIIKKNSLTLALIGGPLILLSCLMLLNKKSEIYQLIGTFYPWFLCGAVVMLDDLRLQQISNKFLTYSFLLLLLISISLHVPRLMGATERFAGSKINRTLQYSKLDFDSIASSLAGNSLAIDLPDVNHTRPLLVELGKRQDISLQWSQQAWLADFGSHPQGAATKIDKHNQFWLVLTTSASPKDHCKVKFKTAQYYLLDCS